jgi:hypothetical protein
VTHDACDAFLDIIHYARARGQGYCGRVTCVTQYCVCLVGWSWSTPDARRLKAEAALMAESRPCERQCAECGRWKHHSRFRLAAGKVCNITDARAVRFSPRCKDCEQKLRNEKSLTLMVP